MSRILTASLAASILTLVLLPGCKGNAGTGTPAGLPPIGSSLGRRPTAMNFRPIDKIKHVIIVIQENRSFNNLFMGYPGATTQTWGYNSKGQKVTLQSVSLATKYDLEHNSTGFYAACDGTGKIPGTHCKMDGFDKVTSTCHAAGKGPCPRKPPAYAYAPRSETTPYFDMAEQYVLADQMYASNFDTSSFVSHLYAIGGQANATTNYPTSNWGCPGVNLNDSKSNIDLVYTLLKKPPRKYGGQVPVCFDNKTLADELDAKKLSWAFYAPPLGSVGPGGKACGKGTHGDYLETGIWSTYQAIKHICYGPDWDKDVFDRPPQFLSDVANGQLRDVTWITPYCKNSDHPGCDSDTGPSWVTSIVNAVGESKFWDSSAIFIFWDDPGGFYDSEAPKYVDYDGLGFRIPMLIVSPYAKKGFVSHTPYEHGSILKFIEDRFLLSPLAASDRRAANPYDEKEQDKDSFDFSQPPRKFVPIQSSYGIKYFLHQAPDYRPPDTN